MVQESEASMPPGNSIENQTPHKNGTQILNILGEKSQSNKQTLEIMQVHEMKDKVLKINENKNIIYQSLWGYRKSL